MEKTSVLMVGGGLVGLSVAVFLAMRGIPAVLVERHPASSPLPRAMGFTTRTMELYRAAGLGDAIPQVPPGLGRPRRIKVESLAGKWSSEDVAWTPGEAPDQQVKDDTHFSICTGAAIAQARAGFLRRQHHAVVAYPGAASADQRPARGMRLRRPGLRRRVGRPLAGTIFRPSRPRQPVAQRPQRHPARIAAAIVAGIAAAVGGDAFVQRPRRREIHGGRGRGRRRLHRRRRGRGGGRGRRILRALHLALLLELAAGAGRILQADLAGSVGAAVHDHRRGRGSGGRGRHLRRAGDGGQQAGEQGGGGAHAAILARRDGRRNPWARPLQARLIRAGHRAMRGVRTGHPRARPASPPASCPAPPWPR